MCNGYRLRRNPTSILRRNPDVDKINFLIRRELNYRAKGKCIGGRFIKSTA